MALRPEGWTEIVWVDAFWARVSEPVEWIASQTDAYLTGLAAILGDSAARWYQGGHGDWPVGSVAQRERTAASVVTFEGQQHPLSGLSLAFHPEPPRWPTVRVLAGCKAMGNIPGASATASFEALPAQLPSIEVIEQIVLLSARVWLPAVAADGSPSLHGVDERPDGWWIPRGYRLWISDEIGSLSEVAEGLSTRRVEGGTLLSTPAEWAPEAMVAAVAETLAANGLDEIPH